ncbi:unnamed protein product [Gongylonema pulchrum]|uniref:Transmembrane protein n=1 Tax=Gongylonema pulchrum TaxID=637853 RepID=A0A183D4G3_9BILA|nr:unnamed protein product [Gongylonema pulchrum]
MDTWRRQCYWGPTGCKDEAPESQPEWFWSLIEFGVRIKRNAPYFGLTVILPSVRLLLLFWGKEKVGKGQVGRHLMILDPDKISKVLAVLNNIRYSSSSHFYFSFQLFTEQFAQSCAFKMFSPHLFFPHFHLRSFTMFHDFQPYKLVTVFFFSFLHSHSKRIVPCLLYRNI